MKKFALAPIMLLMAVLALTGCGSDKKSYDTYRPISRGENGHCYYIDSPIECDTRWDDDNGSYIPLLMPLYWNQRYHGYYSSPAYINRHVPQNRRVAVSEAQKNFGNANRAAIDAAKPTALYKGTNGKTLTGDKVNPGTFGGGSRVKGNPGSRTKICAIPHYDVTVLAKGGVGGGRSGGGSGGGKSGSSGKSGSGSNATKPKGVC